MKSKMSAQDNRASDWDTLSIEDIDHNEFDSFNDTGELQDSNDIPEDTGEESTIDDPHQAFLDKLNSLPFNSYLTVQNRKGTDVVLYPLNYKKFNIVLYQIISCLSIFTILGLIDQSTGSLIPFLSEQYQVSHVQVSNIFLTQTFGYMASALVNDRLHRVFGSQGVFVAASLSLSVFTFILTTRPAWFPLYVMCYFPIGVSIGLIDSVANVLFGSLVVHKNELMGALHSIYGCFSFITPIVINRFGPEHWNKFFYIPCFLGFTGALMSLFAFKFETKEKYVYLCDEKDNALTPEEEASGFEAGYNDEPKPSMLQLFKQQPVCALYTIYLFFYLGTEVGTGSWIFTYLLDIKHGSARSMSYITASFWGGLTFGRMYFGIMTKKWFINEYLASKFYGNVTFLFNTMFLLLTMLPATSSVYFVCLAVCVFMSGMWIGPLFPLASVVALDVLPQKLHISGVSAAISLGSMGAAVLPWIYGIIMDKTSLKLFPVLILLSNAVFQATWLMYPRIIKNRQKVFNQES